MQRSISLTGSATAACLRPFKPFVLLHYLSMMDGRFSDWRLQYVMG